jgi:hypothetical protein
MRDMYCGMSPESQNYETMETVIAQEWLCKNSCLKGVYRQSVESCKKLVSEAGDSLRTQRKGNVCLWKLLPRSMLKID